MKTKDAIRGYVREKRQELEEDWIADMSDVIFDKLVSEQVFEDAGAVACYIGYGSEVRTIGIIDRCFALQKKVCVPAYDKQRSCYRLALINEDTEMVFGRHNISEPSDPEWVASEEVDLFIVPGVAFDLACSRIGYGEGNYDNILSGVAGKKAALAFDFQVFDEIPADEHDISMDMILTETRVIAPPARDERG
ncbi:5-formyltetrahydrofolate cyclo-ligase [bacterium E08(2017)]|nr:5-formyltetrahydrofolate cyclo-ligase [bacterium E08(2017)]